MSKYLYRYRFDFALTFLTVNVRGCNSEIKRKKQFAWIRDSGADIIFLQETHTQKNCENMWRMQWGHTIAFSHGLNNARGVAILFKKGLAVEIHKCELDHNGRFIFMTVTINKIKLNLLNIYAPNEREEQKEFFTNIRYLLGIVHSTNTPLLVGGDFNCVLNDKIDKFGGRPMDNNAKQVANMITDIIEEFSLKDIWRCKNQGSRQYTWNRNDPAIYCRLDMWLVSNEWLPIIKYCKIIPTISTDHKAVILKVQGENYIPRGNGIWKLNTSTLVEDELSILVNKEISEILEAHEWNSENNDKGQIWCHIKTRLYVILDNYCRNRAKANKARVGTLQKQLASMEKNKQNFTEEEQNTYKNLKEKYEEIYTSRTKGAILRSRVKWAAEGERNTKYFMRLENHQANLTNINQLKIDSDKVEEDFMAIMNHIQSFYESLYKENLDTIRQPVTEMIPKDCLPTISNSDKEYLEKPITPQELDLALSQMQEGKAPGRDGLPVEFYKKFWVILRPLLLEVYNEAFERGYLHDNMVLGVIKLIPKPDKDHLELKNWRPITLLNTDYKILSKVLAQRMEMVIDGLIGEDQTGFIRGRYIGQNVRTVLDIMEYCEKHNLEGLIVSLDVEKAYDSLIRQHMLEMLEIYGFGENYRRWVTILHTDNYSQVINRGYLTQKFEIERGVRQGDPLSAYLFILTIEALATAIRRNPNISGITVNTEQFKISQYADDTTIFLSDRKSWKYLQELLKQYESISGFKINQTKTVIKGIGKWRTLEGTIGNIHITTEPVKILGLWMCHDKKRMHDLNVSGKLAKMKNILKSWHTRGLTLQGRIIILKSLVLSQITYIFTNLVIPTKTLKQVDRICFEFIWGGQKKAKIAKRVLIQEYINGGLKAPDIYTMYHTWKHSWLIRLLKMPNCKWKNLVTKEFTKIGGLDYLVQCNYKIDKLGIPLNVFMQEMLKSYQRIHGIEITEKTNPRTILSQTINNNKYIKIKSESFFWSALADANIDRMEDWINCEGNFFPYQTLKNRCQKLNWLQYYQLISAIPKEWKKILKRQTILSSISVEEIAPAGSLNKLCIKNSLLEKQKIIPAGRKKWENEILGEIGNAFWSKEFLAARKMGIERKQYILQYKILHQTIACNKKLHKFKLAESPNCPYCQEEQTMYHMLYECVKVKEMWERLKVEYSKLENRNLTIDLKFCIFNTGFKQPKKWNTLSILLKEYIINSTHKKLELNWTSFIEKAQYKLLLWAFACPTNEMYKKYSNEWSSWCPKLCENEQYRNIKI